MIRELALNWYAALGSLNAAVAYPLRALSDAIGIPALSALLLGVIGATAPCQLTTNAAALAFVMGRRGGTAGVTARAAAYVLGKVATYTLFGALVITLGREVVPVAGIVLVRRALGPLMIVLGLFLIGLLRLRFTMGERASAWLEARAGGGTGGAFLLGAAFSLAFCPTLFLLFFVFTIPLALASPGGAVFPALFAVGTAVPLVALAGVTSLGAETAKAFVRRSRGLDRWVRPAAGAVLLLAGLNDTVTYWML